MIFFSCFNANLIINSQNVVATDLPINVPVTDHARFAAVISALDFRIALYIYINNTHVQDNNLITKITSYFQFDCMILCQCQGRTQENTRMYNCLQCCYICMYNDAEPLRIHLYLLSWSNRNRILMSIFIKYSTYLYVKFLIEFVCNICIGFYGDTKKTKGKWPCLHLIMLDVLILNVCFL